MAIAAAATATFFRATGPNVLETLFEKALQCLANVSALE